MTCGIPAPVVRILNISVECELENMFLVSVQANATRIIFGDKSLSVLFVQMVFNFWARGQPGIHQKRIPIDKSPYTLIFRLNFMWTV